MDTYGLLFSLFILLLLLIIGWGLLGWLRRFLWWFWGIDQQIANQEEMVSLLRYLAGQAKRQEERNQDDKKTG